MREEHIYRRDLIEGEIYRYIFNYDGGIGIAIVKWSNKGIFPWLGLHTSPTAFIPQNNPDTDSGTRFKKSSKVAAPKGILGFHEDIIKLAGRML